MARVIQTPQATRDLTGIAESIAQESVSAALRLIDAYDEAVELLAEQPQLGQIYRVGIRGYEGMRGWPLKGFSVYIVFYLPLDGGIEVLRIVHGMRNLERVLSQDS